MRVHVCLALAGALAGVAAANSALAQDAKLPNPLSWTAYDVGSAGCNQSIAIGKALKDAYGIDLRVLPGKNDVSRQVPLREKKVDFSATGVGASSMAQEGVFEFGAKTWGPQAVRILAAANSDSNLSVGVAADAGVSPILGRAQKQPGGRRLCPNLVGQCFEADSSPRGLYLPPLPHGDKEGWKRLIEKGPFFQPYFATEGANVSKDKPHEAAAYPYPILIAYSDAKDDVVYAMTKAMIELFPKYKDASPGINGWALERQNFKWAVPYHPGAIKYFKEIGKWSAEAQAHNEMLVEFGGLSTAEMKRRLRCPQKVPLANRLQTVLISGKRFAADLTIHVTRDRNLLGDARKVAVRHAQEVKAIARGNLPKAGSRYSCCGALRISASR